MFKVTYSATRIIWYCFCSECVLGPCVRRACVDVIRAAHQAHPTDRTDMVSLTSLGSFEV